MNDIISLLKKKSKIGLFNLADEFGPAKIVHVYEPSVDLRGILVIDNVAAGPAIGGLRISPDVNLIECFSLARAMTLKNAMAKLSHGGGKSVIIDNSKISALEKEKKIRAFAYALRNEEDYIFGPGMGTNEESMAWIYDEIGRAVGLPRRIGGIPLDETGATGFGVCQAAEVAAEYCGFELNGVKVVIQGFGSVGQNAARYLEEKGAVIIAVSDSKGGIYKGDGLDIGMLIKSKDMGSSVFSSGLGRPIDSSRLLRTECDIFIPAARPYVINENNVHLLKTKLIIQGANIPCTDMSEKTLHRQGVLSVPDFIANAGGAISGAMEYEKKKEADIMDTIKWKIRENTKLVLEQAKSKHITPREAGKSVAADKLKKYMSNKRWSIIWNWKYTETKQLGNK